MPSAPPPARRRRSANRRDQLVDAAVRAFARSGVSATSVDDIVREAGVAKGTFYLYFETRDDVVTAVAERLVEGVAVAIDAALDGPGTAAERIMNVASQLNVVGEGPNDLELVEALHRPENATIHDRLGGRIVARLVEGVERAIEDGIRDGEFAPQDARHAATFVLACFTSLHDLVADPSDLETVTAELNAFLLRGLGHRSGEER